MKLKYIKLVLESSEEITVHANGKIEFLDSFADIYWDSTINRFKTQAPSEQYNELASVYNELNLMTPFDLPTWLNIRQLVNDGYSVL